MIDELKPCPFCGGEGELDAHGIDGISWSVEGALVKCIKCESESGYFTSNGLNEETSKKCITDAIAAWNRRHSIDPEQVQRDNLERHNEKVRSDHD